MNAKVKFILGEDKHIMLKVRAPNDEPFTITSASYIFSRYGKVEAEGSCDINESLSGYQIKPERKVTILRTGSDLYSG